MGKPRIVVVGSGWAGYTVSEQLDENQFDVTVISPEATSPYTPLLASATCGLFDFTLAEEPIRHKSKKLQYCKATVENVDFKSRVCKCKSAIELPGCDERTFDVPYDYLVLAPGCVTNTFNTPGADEYAFFVRKVADARRVQNRLMQLLELAALPGTSEQRQRELLHIIIVGGGPTGVEIAAEMSDLFHEDLTKLYPKLAPQMRISIHDAAHHILAPFEDSLRQHAIGSFNKRKVQIVTGSQISQVTQDSIETKAEGKIACGMVLWTAGNKQCALVDRLDVAKTDHLPRIMTDEFLHVLGTDKKPMSEVFALGDAADVKSLFLPTTAEVAVQKSAYLTKAFNSGDFTQPFEYRDKALVAYIGGHDGVVAGKPEWSGEKAWAAWRGKNLMWTRSWRRKIMIMVSWLMNWVGGKEIARA